MIRKPERFLTLRSVKLQIKRALLLQKKLKIVPSTPVNILKIMDILHYLLIVPKVYYTMRYVTFVG